MSTVDKRRVLARLLQASAILSTLYIFPWLPHFYQWPRWISSCIYPELKDKLAKLSYAKRRSVYELQQQEHRSRQRHQSREDQHGSSLQTSSTIISVVIPVYNDGKDVLEQTLNHLVTAHSASQCTRRVDNSLSSADSLLLLIYVVDGGCSDDTLEAIEVVQAGNHLPNGLSREITVLKLDHAQGEFGRGAAMRKGAALAVADRLKQTKTAMRKEGVLGADIKQARIPAEKRADEVLLFLHCDTKVPTCFDKIICESLSDTKVLLSAFSFKVDKTDATSGSMLSGNLLHTLKRIDFTTNLRSRYLWLPYGDQAYAITIESYNQLGGFKDYKLMEDFDLICRARKVCLDQGKRISILSADAPAVCSNRRWLKKGVFKTTLVNWTCVFAYVVCGVSPDTLFTFYYRQR